MSKVKVTYADGRVEWKKPGEFGQPKPTQKQWNYIRLLSARLGRHPRLPKTRRAATQSITALERRLEKKRQPRPPSADGGGHE